MVRDAMYLGIVACIVALRWWLDQWLVRNRGIKLNRRKHWWDE